MPRTPHRAAQQPLQRPRPPRSADVSAQLGYTSALETYTRQLESILRQQHTAAAAQAALGEKKEAMSNFNERLARLADSARLLNDGQEIARALLALAGDVDAYLAEQLAQRNQKLNAAFTAWNDFLNGSLQSAYDETDRKIAIERRTMARIIASDPRWQGGYADALRLLEQKELNEP